MNKRILVVTGLVAALAGGSFALAQTTPEQRGPRVGERRGPGGPGGLPGPRGPRGVGGDFGLRGIELSDAQREQVAAIRQSHQAEFEQVRTRVREAHRAFAEAVNAQPLNDATVRARSADVGAAMADEAILQAKVRAEVFNILTPEQQQTVNERRQKLAKRARPRRQ
jgi:protein CpxP